MQKILGIIYFVIKHKLSITVILDLALTWLIIRRASLHSCRTVSTPVPIPHHFMGTRLVGDEIKTTTERV